MRTFQQLQEAIRLEMQLDPGLISATERKQFINDALSDMGELEFEKDRILTLDSFGKAPFPIGFVQVIAVIYNEVRLDVAGYDMKVTSGTFPLHYVLVPGHVQLIPFPSTGLVRVIYTYRPDPLVNDTDTPDIPEGWDWLLVDYGVGRAHRKNGNLGIYREYMHSYGIGKFRLGDETLKRKNSRLNVERNTEAVETPHPFRNFNLV